ncbi:probable plastid-lipid-associated protein 12, chloroplastic [Tripterygium wilfordii]|uniref:probable plastid-lipid-associated protein 12, chloroplastic n=1 Tax=Tripterygium wilfordii TaxID=458696 RepID=UPI0018F807AE|nr:probable plastid-lipid-associated protein 12, chloroplastic [Tripterygium wilfordii]
MAELRSLRYVWRQIHFRESESSTCQKKNHTCLYNNLLVSATPKLIPSLTMALKFCVTNSGLQLNSAHAFSSSLKPKPLVSLKSHGSFKSFRNQRHLKICQSSLVDEQQQETSFSDAENQLIDALIGIQGRGRSASPRQLNDVEQAVKFLEGLGGVPDPTSSSLIEGRWQLMFTTRPGTASPIQRTFVGVDFFSVFQEVCLRTNDPRVSNIVRFSDAIGELKVEV